jgi:hypothetical protein
MSSDPVRTGIVFDRELLDRLDARKQELDRRSVESVSRSEVVRESADLGLVATELIDDHPELRHLPTEDRRGLVRQAVQDFLDE